MFIFQLSSIFPHLVLFYLLLYTIVTLLRVALLNNVQAVKMNAFRQTEKKKKCGYTIPGVECKLTNKNIIPNYTTASLVVPIKPIFANISFNILKKIDKWWKHHEFDHKLWELSICLQTPSYSFPFVILHNFQICTRQRLFDFW